MDRDFQGGGGGGKTQTPAQPTYTPDNLRSNDRFEIMLGLCRGPIKGLTNGENSFRVGGTRFANADGTRNFLNASLDVFPGYTPGETIRPVIGGYEDFRGVFSPLVPGTTLSITTQTPGTTIIVLRFNVKKLWRRAVTTVLGQFSSDGIGPHTANLAITWSNGAGALPDPFPGNYLFSGKTDTPDVHEVRLVAPAGAEGPFTININQVTPHNPNDAPCDLSLDGYYEIVSGLYGLTRSQNVGVSLSPTVSVTRTTQQPPRRKDGTAGIDMIDIRLLVSQLVENRPAAGGDPGGTFHDAVDLTIEIKKSSDASWTNPFGGAVQIKGKTTGSPVVFEYRIPVVAVDDTWDVRVTRITGDLATFAREMSWESMQEIVGGPARFDGVAVARFVARASNQFSSLPELWGEYDLKLCRIPINYDPITRVYDGPWNGVFKIDWTDNPAWCWHEFVMDDAAGAKRFWPDLEVDRYSVYEAAQWCDELVPDGKGGGQPRFTCNLLMTEGRGVKEQIRYMAGSFNAVPIDELNGQIRLVVDKDRSATAVFSPENIVDGIFEYSYVDEAARFNEITVRFNNRDLDYEDDSRVVRDADHQAIFGVIPEEFAAIGCTNTHEAIRRAAYRLITAITEVEMVSFRVNRRGILVKPLDTILIADPDMGWSLSGRIAYTAPGNLVHFREPLYLENDVLYAMQIDVPDATAPRGVSTRTFQLAGYHNGFTQVVQLADALPADLPEFAVFSLGAAGSDAGAPKAFRVTSIEETEGDIDSIAVSAIEINRNKWLYSDLAEEVAGAIVVKLPYGLMAPEDLGVTTTTALVGTEVKATAELAWRAPGDPRVNTYRVQYARTGEATWIDVVLTRSTRAVIYDIPDGLYDFRVGSIYGSEVAWSELRAKPAGLMVPPANVGRLDLGVLGEMLRLSWPPVPDDDLAYYTIRYTPVLGSGASWNTSQIIVERAVGTSVLVPSLVGTFFIKAVDTSGIESLEAASNATTITGRGLNAIERLQQDPTWGGTKSNVVVDGGLLKKTGSISTVSTYNALTTDLGDVYLCRLNAEMVGSAERAGVHMDDWPDLTSLESLSGVPSSSYDFLLEFRAWDGVNWGEWMRFTPGDWLGQRFSFRVTFISREVDVVPVLLSLALIVDMPDRIEGARNVAVGTGGLSITYSRAFRAIPTIAVTGKNLATGDYLVITSETVSGFTLVVKNSAGTNVARTIDWIANGYGYAGV